MKTLNALSSALTAALLCGGAFAQLGADECSVADDVTAMIGGSVPFDTNTCSDTGTTATTSFEQQCFSLTEDVWFKFTAVVGNRYRIDTCNTANFDTEIGAWGNPGGGCGALVAYGCNDDNGGAGCSGLTSLIEVAAVDPEVYVQLGYWSSAGGVWGSGTLQITDLGPDPCVAAGDDGLEDNDTCSTPVPIGSGLTTGLFVAKFDSDFYNVTVADGTTLTVNAFFTHANADVDIFLYDSTSNCSAVADLVRGFSATDDETLMWTNSTGGPVTYILEVNVYPPTTTGNCNVYDLEIIGAGSGGLGTNYCTATANSSGLASVISGSGSDVAANENVTLIAEQLPASGTPGVFFFGPSQIQVVFGDGFRCVGGMTRRVQPPAFADGTLTATRALDWQAFYGQDLVSGANLNFQFWYRDPMAMMNGFNLTNGLNIVFQ